MAVDAAGIAHRLALFRPSDRAAIEQRLIDPETRDDVFVSVEDFLKGWDGSDWLDEGNIERIGKWFGRQPDREIVAKAQRIADAVQTPARRAFGKGIASVQQDLQIASDIQ